MAQTKSTVLFGVAVDTESSYGGGGTIELSEDGVRMREEVLATISYLTDGGRGEHPSTGLRLKKGVPSAREISFAPSFLIKGSGAVYSATVFPEVHRILRIAGWDAAVEVGAGVETWTYVLTALSGSPSSGFGDGYGRGQKYSFTHAYADMGYVVEAGGYAVMSADIRAVMDAVPTDVSLPSITYSSVMEPKAHAAVLSIGDFITPVWTQFEFQQGRVIESRMGGNATIAHVGFALGRNDPRIIIDLEATALVGSPFHTSAGLDPGALYNAATEISISLQMGSVQYNKWTHTFSACQLIEPPEEPADGPTGKWRLTFQVNNASSWLFD